MTNLMLALVILLGLSQISQAGLLASAYKAVPCSDYAPGCFVEPASVPDDLTWDPFAWTRFWQETYGDTYVGYMTPRDTNIDGWIVGHIWLLYWDEDLWGPWDGEFYPYIGGETQFVYRADVGAICCWMDWPFKIFAINDDGYIFTNGAYYGTGLYHTSTIDSFPGHDAALWPNVIWPGDLYSLLDQPAYFGIDAQGAISVGESMYGMADTLPMFALVPVPEPSTNMVAALSLLVFVVTRRRLASGPKPHR